MKKIITTLSFILINVLTFGQLDSVLTNKIDSMYQIDQKYRLLATDISNQLIDSISIEVADSLVRFVDAANYIEIVKIFEEHGFLGYNKVEKNGSLKFWLLVQHADLHPDFQEKVLNKMKIEAENKNASWKNYAYLIDRVLVNTGRPQIYGSQMEINSEGTSFQPKLLDEPKKVNKRRKKVGLKSIESYIKQMNKIYYGYIINAEKL